MQDSLAIAVAHIMSLDSSPASCEAIPAKVKAEKPVKVSKVKSGEQSPQVIPSVNRNLNEENDVETKPMPIVLPPAIPSAPIARAFFERTAQAKDRNECAKVVDDLYFAGILQEKSKAPLSLDTTLPFGTQYDLARFAARSALRPVKAHKENFRSAHNTLRGFVAGMPDNIQKAIADLESRERVAAEVICDFNKQVNDLSLDEMTRTLAEGRITIEYARLQQIRKDLDNLRG